MFWVTKSCGNLYPLYWKRGYFLRPLLHLWVCIIPWWHIIFSDGLPMLPSSCLVPMGRFCKALGTQHLAGGMGSLPAAPSSITGWGYRNGSNGAGWLWLKHRCQSFPQWPTFSLSCCSQLLVDTAAVVSAWVLLCFVLICLLHLCAWIRAEPFEDLTTCLDPYGSTGP